MPNRLLHETSPYLLQHAHNPVDWYGWGEEAFAKAKKENKPVLVSIGYSTCHWCHVMERESFENEAVADFMNEHFVNIKVDREERPDLDQIYMEVCQIINRNGGWPLNVFLLPDKRPFYAGTYYPPQSGHGRPSWLDLLAYLKDTFHNKPKEIESQADRLLEAMKGSSGKFLEGKFKPPSGERVFMPSLLDRIFEVMKQSFDRLEGGFGSAPKFPGAMSLDWLLDYFYYSKNQSALDHVLHSLDKMCRGGIYDQIGGGFSRYATDRAWLIPHFEKMLYDNALLICVLAKAYKLTKKELYRKTIEQTLEWAEREMTDPSGAFFSALDADSEGVEGKFYVWDKSEIDELLGEDALLFNRYFDVSETGNWEHKNILNRNDSLKTFCERAGIDDSAAFSELIGESSKKLMQRRAKRIRPGLDNKILLDWNALMCTAYAKAYEALGDEEYKNTAIRNLDFLFEKMKKSDAEGFYHTYSQGIAKYDAFLDDYANLIEACIAVYEITFDENLIDKALKLADLVQMLFYDEKEKLYYFTSIEQEEVVLRQKNLFDNAVPSGNSTMAINLLKLAILADRPDFRKTAEAMLEKTTSAVLSYPTSFSKWASGILSLVHPIREIAVTGKDAFEFSKKIGAQFLPNRTIAGTDKLSGLKILEDKLGSDKTLIFLCEDFVCQRPVETVDELFELIPDTL